MTEDEMRLFVQQRGGQAQRRTDGKLDFDEGSRHGMPHEYEWIEPAEWTDEESLFAESGQLPPWGENVCSAWFRVLAMAVAAGGMLCNIVKIALPAKAEYPCKVSV